MNERPYSTLDEIMKGGNISEALSRGVTSILAYCGSSILMTVTNKYVLSGREFNLNFFLLAFQSIICVVCIQVCKWMGWINFRNFHMDEAKKWFPISCLLVGMVYTGTKALQYLEIPVYTIFKNLTIILIAYGEVFWFGGQVTEMSLFSFGLMVLSSVVAAWADIRHSMGGDEVDYYGGVGYIWMLLNCLCSASYVLAMRKRIKLTNFRDFDTMFYNNLLTIPVLSVCTLLLENWTGENWAKNFPVASRHTIILAMIFSGLSSVFISYSSAWCVRVTSSTTYSMVGALNKLPIAVSGIVLFGAPVTFGSVLSIVLGFVAGLVYTIAKIQEQQRSTDSVQPEYEQPLKTGMGKNGDIEVTANLEAGVRGESSSTMHVNAGR